MVDGIMFKGKIIPFRGDETLKFLGHQLILHQFWRQPGVHYCKCYGILDYVYYYWFRCRDQPVNYHGDTIPRIVTVRRNLRLLGKPTRKPRIPD